MLGGWGSTLLSYTPQRRSHLEEYLDSKLVLMSLKSKHTKSGGWGSGGESGRGQEGGDSESNTLYKPIKN